ncbi:hypothetical protein GQ56_0126445 [Burkholderia paludis]|uniref:hypothetical protein n=1 Tax=Burkholderia paludis TaxID=1506587 RepID=UPI0004DB5D30|nr:hypothetical protein [Burkholderia paludis]KFG94400.1 hypothetical protein GQ56_0126445 [Burkholderia paludis]
MSTAASARPEQSTEIKQLRLEIQSIDSICQSHLDQIEALSEVALLAMEAPEFWAHPGTLQNIVKLIGYLASDLTSSVSADAESVHCGFINTFDMERNARVIDAFRKAQKSGAHHG